MNRQTFLKYFFFCGMLTALLFTTSCNNDDDEPAVPTPGAVNLTLDKNAFEAGRGNRIDVGLTLNAEDGIKSLTAQIDGGNTEDLSVTAGSTSQTVTYAFEIPGNTTMNTQFSIEFVLTDETGTTASATATVTSVALIATPDTYAFTRNGETTVSYSGQIDRLNMVEEIKNGILKEGDQGNVISEQVLLDAFANTGDNGGGFYSFTSDRQLKSKTFQPDLDDRLFENLFASAATASVAASGGQMAANGTAGLLIRENSGNTVLVDENGREFTQLIEKGLMGAVFYNQIYNVYLSDARTGDDVENTAPARRQELYRYGAPLGRSLRLLGPAAGLHFALAGGKR